LTMRLPQFDYYAPTTLEEAFELLQSKGPDARVMAGGTDLVIKMRHGALKPKAVIGLKNIKALNTITVDEQKGLTIGATALLAEVAHHPEVERLYPTIAEAARGTANVQVRNMGTVIGNLCNASPAADNAPTLLAMGAVLHIRGPKEERVLPLDQFFKGPGMTALAPFEIVTAVHVPVPPPHTGTAYMSLSARGQMDCTAIGIGAMVTLNGQICLEGRIFIGACGPLPLHASKTENVIRGRELTEDVLAEAGACASEESQPITDVRASAGYRKNMVAVLARRVLKEAHAMALGK
jgi:CO/xanthine dehydrogenase FAD-binding subunit